MDKFVVTTKAVKSPTKSPAKSPAKSKSASNAASSPGKALSSPSMAKAATSSPSTSMARSTAAPAVTPTWSDGIPLLLPKALHPAPSHSGSILAQLPQPVHTGMDLKFSTSGAVGRLGTSESGVTLQVRGVDYETTAYPSGTWMVVKVDSTVSKVSIEGMGSEVSS